MQRNTQDSGEIVFVIELCQNIKASEWHSRLDENKYLHYFNMVSEAIVERIPHAVTMRNQIPKSYLPYDLYCNLIPNNDPNVSTFMQVPRLWAFEVSYKGHLIFSKLQGKYWPNVELVATKCAGIVEAIENGEDVSPFLAQGSSGRARGNSPKKQGTAKKSQNIVTPQKASPSQQQPVQQEVEPPVKPFKADDSQKFLEPLKEDTKPEELAPIKIDSTDNNDAQMVEQPAEEPKKEEAPETVCGPHLKSIDDLKSFPKFKEGEQNSMLCKHMTEDVWNKYHDKTDSLGVTFKQCVLSGCQNTDSGIGVYAASPDSYNAFSDLFTPIIEGYHKVGINDGHTSNMDHNQLNCPPFAEEDAKMIKSTRIRVGRNLAAYPLGPGISKEQRKEVEKLVVEALSKFDDDLKGTYYSLETMSADDQKQLIADHFLFKEGDRFLEACGLNRDWPEGRGIFHNDAKTFLVWVNEEDQLRIISMQQGSDIGAVFSRLARAANQIEEVAKFSHTPNLGYITSCPTNLGTALRASVHIHLPLLGQNKADFQAIADKFHVQIRGAHGEHTETDDHIYDISNKRRLGRSEKDLVQDMYDGVSAMIAAEKALRPAEDPKQATPAKQEETPKKEQEEEAPKQETPKKAEETPKKEEESKEESGAADITCGPHLKSVDDLTGFPVFPAGQDKSALAKHLTRACWDELHDKVDSQGVSFKQCILSGCQNTDSGIGCYAGSHKGYYEMATLFDPVILDYHQHDKDAKHISNMNYQELNCPPFDEEDAKMIKSTRIRVGRNLAKFPLGPGISKEQRNEVEDDAQKAFQSFEGELAGKYYPLGSMSEADRAQLVADHFLFKQGDRFLEACGLNRDWPEGRGIFHNDAKTFLCWVNEEDQFRIISMQPGADIGAVFKRLSDAAAAIEKVAEFAHDDHLGYITSCPTNLGTALRASVHIHLPLLGQNKADFQAIADKYYVQIRGAHGEHTETDDHIYDISNRRRLGRSEKDLVQDMYDGVKAMIEAEKKLRPAEDPKQATPAKEQEEAKQETPAKEQETPKKAEETPKKAEETPKKEEEAPKEEAQQEQQAAAPEEKKDDAEKQAE